MKLRLFPIVMVCLSISVQAELRLASVITDHAVLQRDSPIHVWGEASPAEQVTITFHAQSVATTANRWACGMPGSGRNRRAVPSLLPSTAARS